MSVAHTTRLAVVRSACTYLAHYLPESGVFTMQQPQPCITLCAYTLEVLTAVHTSTPALCHEHICRHLVLPASGTSISRGVAFFTLDGSGRITSITDSPEHPVKLSARGLTVFGPLVQGMASTMLPAVQELGR